MPVEVLKGLGKLIAVGIGQPHQHRPEDQIVLQRVARGPEEWVRFRAEGHFRKR